MSKSVNIRKTVKTTSTKLMMFKVSELQHLVFSAIGAFEISEQPVSYGNGDPLSGSERKVYSHLDYRKDDKEIQNSIITVYGVSSVETTVHVTGRA